MKQAVVICLVVLIAVNCVSSRWLPTRSQEDRLDKLREMLKDLLESEIEKSNYEGGKYMYKRDVGSQIERSQTAEGSRERDTTATTTTTSSSSSSSSGKAVQ